MTAHSRRVGSGLVFCIPSGGTPAGVTCVDYDVFDNPTKVTDGRGNATEYLHNGFGVRRDRGPCGAAQALRKVSVLSPDAGLSMFALDEAGLPISRATADGRTTRWVRDARGRIESATTEADGGSASGGVLTGHGLAICTVVPLLGPMQICLPNGLHAPGLATGGGTPHVVDYVWDTGTNGIGRRGGGHGVLRARGRNSTLRDRAPSPRRHAGRRRGGGLALFLGLQDHRGMGATGQFNVQDLTPFVGWPASERPQCLDAVTRSILQLMTSPVNPRSFLQPSLPLIRVKVDPFRRRTRLPARITSRS